MQRSIRKILEHKNIVTKNLFEKKLKLNLRVKNRNQITFLMICCFTKQRGNF